MSHAAIGMFDSGLGGFSVYQHLKQLYPNESIIYFADRDRCPYGSRSPSEILEFSREISQYLLTQSCKLVVVACNTATAAAIQSLRSEFSLPFVGMEPALKPAAAATKTGVIGVLATKGTFAGGHFLRTSQKYAADVKIVHQIGEGLVEAVESGNISGLAIKTLLKKYLLPMLEQGADQIVLGCTHYPFLRELIQHIIGNQAQIVDPAPAVARQTGWILDHYQLRNPHSLQQEPDCIVINGDILSAQTALTEMKVQTARARWKQYFS